MKNAMKVALHHAGLYRPIARITNEWLGTARGQRRRILLRLYRPLIRLGELVFDVGAHDGTYCEVFAALGARVVAVEPNPDSIPQIRMRCPRHVRIVRTAIGPVKDVATLHILPGYPSASSLSDAWVKTAEQAPRFRGLRWTGAMRVPVTTLDLLRGQYGDPNYIKMDIEGYEEPALDGLTLQPPLLSIEYNAEALDALVRCLHHRVVDPASRFACVIGDSGELSAWTHRDAFLRRVETLPSQTFGDVFIRR